MSAASTAPASIRIEVKPDIEGGWAVTRDCIIDGYFVDVGAANDYASACAQRARRAGIAVSLQVAPPPPSIEAA
ncbi:hypothetical protein [uncultured Luteimonas sp.]|uniref:hypothetical protein n=1 Tax=uncultured Luteimonas sp. TaxID=453144 RepID=UPI00261E84A0|nr:hypothetical protein [uncultured Luteimonas sp.]